METSLHKMEVDTKPDLAKLYQNALKLSMLTGLSTGAQKNFASSVTELCRQVLQYIGKPTVQFLLSCTGKRYYLEARISNSPIIRRYLPLGNKTANVVSKARTFLLNSAFRISSIWFRQRITNNHISTKQIKEWQAELARNTALHTLPAFQQYHNQISYFLASLQQNNQSLLQHYEQDQQLIEHIEKLQDELATQLNMKLQQMQQLEQTNKALEEFALTVTHDLKAPLQNLDGLITMLECCLEKHDNPDDLHTCIEMVKSQITRMNQFIVELLGSAQQSRTHTAQVLIYPSRFLQNLVQSIAIPPLFSVKIKPDISPLKANPVELTQIFTNLISNAIKHHDRNRGTITIAGDQQNEWMNFTVTDDGPGIAADAKKKLFEAFECSESKVEGANTGLGLYIAYKIICKNGGKITVNSEGRGAAFSFTWPVNINQTK